MTDMNIEDVRRLDGRLVTVFLDLLRTGNATTTAEHLGLSQSAVSHALARLRRLHDDPLFIRRPHGLEPTRRAVELAPLVEQVADFARRLYGPPEGFDPKRSSRRFRLAVPEFVVATIGGPLLARWATTAPGVSIVTEPLAHDLALEQVRSGQYDLVIGRYPHRLIARGLRQRSLYHDDYCVVARREHPTIRGPLDVPTYLDIGHVVAESVGEGDPGESIPRRLRIAAVVPGWLTALSLVASSDRVATCPRQLAQHHAERLGLRILDVPNASPEIEVSAVARDPITDPAVEWLWNEVHDLCAEFPRQEDGGGGRI